MPDNSGIIIGGDNSGNFSNVSTGGGQQVIGGPADSRAATLAQIDELIDRLVAASFGDLPAESVGVVAREAKALKTGVHDDHLDPSGIRKSLSVLFSVAASAAPVVELVRQLADLVTQLLH